MLEELLKLIQEQQGNSKDLSEPKDVELLKNVLNSSATMNEAIQNLQANGIAEEQVKNALNFYFAQNLNAEQKQNILNANIDDLKDPFPLPKDIKGENTNTPF